MGTVQQHNPWPLSDDRGLCPVVNGAIALALLLASLFQASLHIVWHGSHPHHDQRLFMLFSKRNNVVLDNAHLAMQKEQQHNLWPF
jgi:hypothetical protein